MALIKCPECKSDISEKAKTCPKCGHPIASENPRGTNTKTGPGCCGVIALIVGVAILIAFLAPGIDLLGSKIDKSLGVKAPPTHTPSAEDKLEARRIAKHGQQISKYWVKSYLKRVAKDPDSVEIFNASEVSYNEKSGWLMLVDWGAKNSFGGMTREVNWFVMHNGVITMKPSDAYR